MTAPARPDLTRGELLAVTLDRQHLLRRDASCVQVASDLLGLQAQFSTGPRDALRARASDFSPQGWDRGLVKIWSHRGTIHVVPARELWLHLSARDNRGPLANLWDGWGIPVGEAERWADVIRAEVSSGPRGREELKEACRAAGMSDWLLERVFNGWGGLLKEMCDRGMLVYEAGTAKRFSAVPEAPEWLPRDEARAELVRRYFERYGPATMQDCAAFLGYRASEVASLVRRSALPLRELTCRGATLSYLGELPSPTEARVPGCVLLAPFDQIVLGYRDRSRLIDAPDLSRVTNRAGIVFAAVLYRGRARARWRREGRRVTVTEFRPLSDTARAAIAGRVRRFFSPERMEVRFRGEKDVPAPRPFDTDGLPSELRARGGAEG